MKKAMSLMGMALMMFAASTQAVEIQSNVTSGNWTDSATWSPTQVPTSADRVLIKFDDTVTVDSAGNEAGSLRLDAGKSFLNLDPGGELTVLNSGSFPTNGSVTFKWAGAPCTLNVHGGSFIVDGNFALDGGNSGVTNYLNVASGSIDCSSFFEVGVDGGGGLSMISIEGSDASFRVGGNMRIGSSAILNWKPAADGSVTAIVSDNFKNVLIDGGMLVVDMTAMSGLPSEIILIDNNGTDAIDGTFAATNLIGNSDYELSYTGGDGNDIVLAKTVTVPPSSSLIAGWTRAQEFPSEKTPAENALKVRMDEIDISGISSKFDRGSGDLTYGSGLFTNVADEAAFHGSTSCYALGVEDALRVVITNDYGVNGKVFELDYVLLDWTAPFAQSPKTLNVKYVEGDLGIPTNTLLATDSMLTSGQTGLDDYADVDADLTGFDSADRTLTNGQYAVFEITVSTNVFGSDGACYIDNIALAATVSTNKSGYEAWSEGFELVEGPEGDDDDDLLSNLYEFGVGGDPTNSADVGYLSSITTTEASGTNYFEYVHARRTTPGNGLTYYLEQNTDLVFGTWTNTGDYIEMGIDPMPSDPAFESVTNWISTEGKSQEFIKLIIE